MTDATIVTIFGGASPRPGSPAYEEAEMLGRLLAQAGYTVMTGGYAGTMEAASKGAKEAGGHVIGVTVGLLEHQFNSRVNPYVDEIIHYETLYDRMHHLVGKCGAAIGLRGGIGTLSEVSLTWSLLQTGEIGRMPLVLLGQPWADTLSQYYADGAYIRAEYMRLWKVAHTPAEAVSLIREWQ